MQKCEKFWVIIGVLYLEKAAEEHAKVSLQL